MSVDTPVRLPDAAEPAPSLEQRRARRRAAQASAGPSEFADLTHRVKALDLMERRYGYYGVKASIMVLALGGVVAGFVLLGDSWFQLILAAALAVIATQVAFLAHDAGHRQIFTSARRNEWASLLLANLVSGMSSQWWARKHTKHHSAPNQLGKDPDIESSVLAFTPEAGARRGPVGRWLGARQGWFFFPLLLLEGANLHVQSVKSLCARSHVKRRWLELSFVSVRLVGYLAAVFLVLPPGKAAAFVGVQLGLFGVYMGCSFAPNHKGMPQIPEGSRVDFLRRQVLMSRNITGGRFTSFVFGGLNHQIEHHLFPSMPRPNLARARAVVKPFCAEKNITYTETTVMASYAIVVRYLNRVGLGQRDPFECPIVATHRPRTRG